MKKMLRIDFQHSSKKFNAEVLANRAKNQEAQKKQIPALVASELGFTDKTPADTRKEMIKADLALKEESKYNKILKKIDDENNQKIYFPFRKKIEKEMPGYYAQMSGLRHRMLIEKALKSNKITFNEKKKLLDILNCENTQFPAVR